MDEQDQIVNTMRPYIQEQGLQPTKANLMAAYTGRVRSNIHMVLCMRYRRPSQPHGPVAGAGEHPGPPRGEVAWACPPHHWAQAALLLCPGRHAAGLSNDPGSWVPGGRGVSVSQGLI